MAEPIEWRVFQRRDPGVKWLVAVLVGLIAGAPAGVVVGVGLEASGWTGTVDHLLAGLSLVVAAGATAVVFRWVRLRSEEESVVDWAAIDAAEFRWLPVGSLVATSLVVTAPLLAPGTVTNLTLMLVVIGGLGVLAVRTLRGIGRYDPESDALSFDGQVIEVGRARLQTVGLGPLTLLVVRRPVPDPVRQFTVVPMPTHVYGEIRSVVGRSY